MMITTTGHQQINANVQKSTVGTGFDQIRRGALTMMTGDDDNSNNSACNALPPR